MISWASSISRRRSHTSASAPAGNENSMIGSVEEVMPLPADLVGEGDLFRLRVRGDSMIEAGILDGDYVVARVQRMENAENGTIVVALIDESEVTLKRLRRRGASIALEPANQAYETRIFGPDRVRIQGRLVGLMRRY